MFSHSQNILTVLYKPQLFFIPQVPLSPLKVIYVQIVSVTPFVKDLSHLSGEGPTQHDFTSHEQAAAAERAPCQRGLFASCMKASVYQTAQNNVETHASSDSLLNNLR